MEIDTEMRSQLCLRDTITNQQRNVVQCEGPPECGVPDFLTFFLNFLGKQPSRNSDLSQQKNSHACLTKTTRSAVL